MTALLPIIRGQATLERLPLPRWTGTMVQIDIDTWDGMLSMTLRDGRAARAYLRAILASADLHRIVSYDSDGRREWVRRGAAWCATTEDGEHADPVALDDILAGVWGGEA